jgi:hypothetical protein
MTREFAQVPCLYVENWLLAVSQAESLMRRIPLALNPKTPPAAPHTR